jgi:hypothetical protein
MSSIEQWKLSYQVSPIFLTGAPVANVPSGMIPFLSIVNPGAFPVTSNEAYSYSSTGGVAGPDLSMVSLDQKSLDDAFGAFNVLAGGSLIQQTVAKYPFANQSYAANAILRDPLHVSLIWDTPMRGENAWGTKLTVMQAVKQRLDAHNNGGGTYIVVTPSYVYDNLVMLSLTDASRGASNLPQNAWRFDFERPLVVLAELRAAQSALMSKLTNGVITNGAWSGPAAGLGSTTSIPNMGSGPNAPIPSMTASGVPSGTPSGPSSLGTSPGGGIGSVGYTGPV